MTAQTETKPAQEVAERKEKNLPTILPPRLPYHPALEERFGVGQAEWRALVDAIFPLAKEASSIILALSYCRARKIDPFKRVVHIVPMWNASLGRMVETVWPGIGELRTTAFRTRQYAGRDGAEFGPTVTNKIGTAEVTYPEWCQITAYRILDGQKYPFPGPRVYWMEAYSTSKKDDPTPNSMWRKRPFGQLDKCAEAAALRAAFPEEIGNDHIAEEMENKTLGTEPNKIAKPPHKTLSAKLDALAADPEADPPHDPETGEIIENNTPSSATATTLNGEAAATGDPGMGTGVETGAGEEAHSEPAPDPQVTSGPLARPDVSRDEAGNGGGAGGRTRAEAGGEASPRASPPATADDARKARVAEIKREGEEHAKSGQAALMNFLEHLRERGEADYVTGTVKTAWREVARMADAGKGSRK